MPYQALTIREETADDRAAIRAVHRAAFSGEAEADLADGLWEDGDALFGLVAAVGDTIIGHILFSRLPIVAGESTIPAAALAPLGIEPAWQRRGIGTALVRHGLRRCRTRSVAAVVVLGDPAYYERFGFRTETAQGLRAPWSGPNLMAIELAPGGLGEGSRETRYPTAFARLPAL